MAAAAQERQSKHPAAASYAGAWSQIEAGFATMAGLPLLVAPQGDVRDAVFAPDVWRDRVYGAQIDLCAAGDGARDQSIAADVGDAVRVAPPRVTDATGNSAALTRRLTSARSGEGTAGISSPAASCSSSDEHEQPACAPR